LSVTLIFMSGLTLLSLCINNPKTPFLIINQGSREERRYDFMLLKDFGFNKIN